MTLRAFVNCDESYRWEKNSNHIPWLGQKAVDVIAGAFDAVVVTVE